MYHVRSARKVRTFRPRVELLEARAVLSTFTVTRLADDALAGSLRWAITEANASPGDDIIDFQPGLTGTINLQSALPDLSSNIDMQGPGASSLTVRGTGGSRVFTVSSAATVEISGLAVTNGFSGQGGGIYNGGTLTVSNANVSGNRGQSGAGIYNGGTLTVSSSIISNNSGDLSETLGGGIMNFRGTLTVSSSTIVNNSVWECGGGIMNWEGTLTVSSSTVWYNSATYGICLDDTGPNGGGLMNYYGGATIRNSTIHDNWAGHHREPTIHGNGGGIMNWEGTLTISSSTISSNSAFYGFGGGITSYGSLHMRNTIVAGNAADYSGPDLSGALTSSGYNLIGNTRGGSGYADTDLLNVNPLLGPLQANGGPTHTHALLPGSPALNAGDPDQLGVADQRGVARAGGVNIGAYQASASAFVLTAPATVTAGVPFDLTVTAVDIFGQVALGYTGTVTFSTTDPDGGVVLPADYTFTADDQGTHTFHGECTLLTPGAWDLTVTDWDGGFSVSLLLEVTE